MEQTTKIQTRDTDDGRTLRVTGRLTQRRVQRSRLGSDLRARGKWIKPTGRERRARVCMCVCVCVCEVSEYGCELRVRNERATRSADGDKKLTD